MRRIAGIALLAVGILLIVWGLKASGSVESDFSRAFTGAPTDKALYMLVGGGVLAVVGAGAAFIPGSKSKK